LPKNLGSVYYDRAYQHFPKLPDDSKQHENKRIGPFLKHHFLESGFWAWNS